MFKIIFYWLVLCLNVQIILSVPANIVKKCGDVVADDGNQLSDGDFKFELIHNDEPEMMNDEALGDVMQRIRLARSQEDEVVNTNDEVALTNDELNYETLTKALQRMNIDNNIRGNRVTTNQNVNEYNVGRYPSVGNGMSPTRNNPNNNEIMKRLMMTNKLQGKVVKTNQQIQAVNNDDFDRTPQRLSVDNNISGDQVKTNQKVTEINQSSDMESKNQLDAIGMRVVKELQRLAMQKAVDGNKLRENMNTNDDAEEIFQRMTLLNKIKGNDVKTNQKVNEINMDDEENDVAEQLQRISLLNKIKGNDVNTNQKVTEQNMNDSEALQRVAVINKIQGNQVNTNQKVREVNDEMNLEDVLKRLEMENQISGKIVNTNQKVDEVNLKDLEALQRLAISSNIRGNQNVNTNQKVTEKNSRSSEALQRLAISTKIRGDQVNTNQRVEEVNDEMNLEDVLKRLEMSNQIDGKIVNTNQKVDEINLKDSEALQRLAISSNIRGKNVDTKQKVREVNKGSKVNDLTVLEEILRRILSANKVQGRFPRTNQGNLINDEMITKTLTPSQKAAELNDLYLDEVLKRIAISNEIDGGKVNTNQQATETNYNDLLKEAFKRATISTDIKETNQKATEMNFNDLLKEAIKRAAVSNNILGKNVTTNQDIKEVNSKQKKPKPTKKLNDFELEKVLKRSDISNKITGGMVTTNQDIKEINTNKKSVEDELADMIAALVERNDDKNDDIKRAAIANIAKGETVNTNFNIHVKDKKPTNDNKASDLDLEKLISMLSKMDQ
ncbi:unnamed protein product [Diamesa tonsa]